MYNQRETDEAFISNRGLCHFWEVKQTDVPLPTRVAKTTKCLAQFAIDVVLAGRRWTVQNAVTLDTIIAAGHWFATGTHPMYLLSHINLHQVTKIQMNPKKTHCHSKIPCTWAYNIHVHDTINTWTGIDKYTRMCTHTSVNENQQESVVGELWFSCYTLIEKNSLLVLTLHLNWSKTIKLQKVNLISQYLCITKWLNMGST